LPGHVKLIEEFTSVQVQNSKLGQAVFTLKAATENIASGILIKRITSFNKLMRSITKGSNENRVGTPSSIIKSLTKVNNRESREFSENVPEDN